MTQRKATKRAPKMSPAAQANVAATDATEKVQAAPVRKFLTGREMAGGYLQFPSGCVCQVLSFSDSDKFLVSYIRDGRVTSGRVRHMHTQQGAKFLPSLTADPQSLAIGE